MNYMPNNQQQPQGPSPYNQQQQFVQKGYIPQLQCFGQMSRNQFTVAQAVAGCLIDLIQDTANDNAVRLYVFNELAVNGFANQAFEDIVLQVMDALGGAVSESQQPTNELLPQIVFDYMRCYYADTLLNRANFLQNNMPPTAIAEAQRAMVDMQNITRLIGITHQAEQRQYQPPMQQPYAPQPNQYAPQPNQYAPPQQPYPAPMPGNNGGMYRQPVGNQGGYYNPPNQPFQGMMGNANQQMAGVGSNFNQHFAAPAAPRPQRSGARVTTSNAEPLTLAQIHANRAKKERGEPLDGPPNEQPTQEQPAPQQPAPQQPQTGYPSGQYAPQPQQTNEALTQHFRGQTPPTQHANDGSLGVTRTVRNSPVMEVMDADGYRDYRTEQEKANDAIASARQRQRENQVPQAATVSRPFLEREDLFDDVPFKETFVNNGVATPESEAPVEKTRTVTCLDGSVVTFPGDEKTRPLDYRLIEAKNTGRQFEVIPAHLSPWVPNDLYDYLPDPCDPNLEMTFHRRWVDTGKVEEFTVLLDTDMDYMRHEPNHVNRQKGGRDKHHVPMEPNWKDVEDIKPPKESEEDGAFDYEDVKDNDTPFIVPEIFTACNLREAEFERDLYFLNKGLNKDQQKNTHEFSYTQVTPFMELEDDTVGETQTDVLDELAKSNTLNEYHEKLGQVDTDNRLNNRIWHYLNDQATLVINDALASSMPRSVSDWRIDDFFSDWPHLLEEFINDLGEDTGGELFRYFERYIRPRVILAGGTVLKGSGLKEWTKSYPGPSEDSPTMFNDNVTVLARQCSVTNVAWSLADMDYLFSVGDVVNIKETRRPRVYAAIKSILERNRRAGGLDYHNHYIRTADNATIEIHRGIFNKEHFVLRLVTL